MTSEGLQKKLWFVVFERQDGVDVFPVQSERRLTHDQAIQVIQRHIAYDPRHDSEWIEIQGPCTPDVI